jgi:hypothetical protein
MNDPETAIQSAIGRPGRTVLARLTPGMEVMGAIIALIKTHSLKSGTITAIGSLKGATVVYPKAMKWDKDPMEAAEYHTKAGPVELGIGHGIFGTGDKGEVTMHLHALIMDKDGDLRSGNLVPGSAEVLATVELTIQEIEGAGFKPTLHPQWNHKFLIPQQG